ncbi:LysR family transcriptional regulator [Vineibacter terrae]|uniref:LysR family transcriptional regulator n=1 Tax=Vineibacter terrae TaxID=2586908 RepID=A0A5C8PIT9_9HYPH|nr:LysR family transcriptional regulator [Vineibacter terrae]TXL73150.1 LysR family transcriptional regulator [Vineibacter terrae]
MNLRQIEAFRAVMTAGTVRGAAELLRISEPAVSKLLALAERRAGIRLFDRVKGRLVPTPEARALHREVGFLWQRVERVRDTLQALANPTSSSLSLSVSPSLVRLVPPVVNELYAQIPALNCRVTVTAPSELVAEVAEGGTDIGIALAPPAHPGLIEVARYQCGLVCVMPAGHKLARRRVVRKADLDSHRLITIERTSGVLEQAFAGLEVSMELRSGPIACWFVQAGVGVALVDAATMAGESDASLVARPFQPSPAIEVLVLRHAARPLSRTAERFCRLFDAMWKKRLP